MESTGNSSSQPSAMPALSDGSLHAVATQNGPEDSYATPASSSSQLADAEARFQAAKSRLLSLIRTSVDKVASGQYDSNTDSTQGNVNGLHANGISTTNSSSGALSPSSGRQGDRGRTEGYAGGTVSTQASAPGRGLHKWEQDKDLVSTMPLMQSVKPKSRQSVRRSGSVKAGMLGAGAQGGGPTSPGRSPFDISPSKVAKAAAQQKDFDLRLGPAYNLEMERMRRRLMTEERRKREEASASMARMVQQRQEQQQQQQQQREEHGGPRSAEGAHTQDGRPSTMGATARAGSSHGRGAVKPTTAGGRRPGRPTNSARPARGGDPGSSEKEAVAYGPGSRQGSLILPPVSSAGPGVGDLHAGHSHSMMMMASTNNNGQVIPASAAINVNGVQMAGYVPAPSSSSYGPYGGMYAPLPPGGGSYGPGGAGGGLGGGPPVMFGAYIMTPMGPVPAQYAAAYGGGAPSSAAVSPRPPSPIQPGGPSGTQQPQQQQQLQGTVGSSGSVLMNGSMYGAAQPGGAYYSYPSMQAAPYYSYPAASASQLQLPADTHPSYPHAHAYPQQQQPQAGSPHGHSSASHAQPAHSNGRAATAGKAHKGSSGEGGEGLVCSPYGKLKPHLTRGSSSQGRGKSRGSSQKQGSPAGAGGAAEGFHSGPSGTSPIAGPPSAGTANPAGMGMGMGMQGGPGGMGPMGMPLYFSTYPTQQQQAPSSAAAMSLSYASSSSLLSQYGIGSGGATAAAAAAGGTGAGTGTGEGQGAVRKEGGQGTEEPLPEMLAGEIEVEEDEAEGE